MDERRFGDRNIEMAGDLMHAILDDPSILEQIPNGATVIFLPDDDPELVEYNIGLGVEAARSGENVYFVHVNQPAAVSKAS